jgi:hypothetical protein
MKKTLEEEKQEILKIAEDNFGNEYFDKLNKLTEYLSSEEEKYKGYSLTVNYEGAFYASEK